MADYQCFIFLSNLSIFTQFIISNLSLEIGINLEFRDSGIMPNV
jgi:hypothetical protein